MGYRLNPLTGDLIPVDSSGSGAGVRSIRGRSISIDFADSLAIREASVFQDTYILPLGIYLPAEAIIQMPTYIEWNNLTLCDIGQANGVTWARNNMPGSFGFYTDDCDLINVFEVSEDIWGANPSKQLVKYDNGSGADFLKTTIEREIFFYINGGFGTGTVEFTFTYNNP